MAYQAPVLEIDMRFAPEPVSFTAGGRPKLQPKSRRALAQAPVSTGCTFPLTDLTPQPRNRNPVMADPAHVSWLEEQLQDIKQKLTDTHRQNTELQKSNAEQAKVIKQNDSDLDSRNKELSTLQTKLDESKNDLQDKADASSNLEELLTNAHADTDAKARELQRAQEQIDNLKVALHDTELQLKSITEQWQEEQERVHQMENLRPMIDQLTEQLEALKEEVAESNRHIDEQNRTLAVKDVRISNLEGQVQKSLQVEADLRSAAEANSSTTGVPNVVPANDSLQDELEAVHEDTFEYDDVPCDISDITVIRSESPIEPTAPSLSTASTQTETKLTTATTQTDTPTLTISAFTEVHNVAPVQITPPNLTIAALTEVASVEPTEPFQVIEPHQAEVSDALIQTDPQPPISAPVHLATKSTQTMTTPTTAVETAPSASTIRTTASPFITPALRNMLFYIALTTLIFFLAMNWIHLRAWNHANTSYNYGNYYGAYGTPRYLFGIIPVGHDIGNGPWSESFAKLTAFAIQSIEAKLGSDRVALF